MVNCYGNKVSAQYFKYLAYIGLDFNENIISIRDILVTVLESTSVSIIKEGDCFRSLAK